MAAPMGDRDRGDGGGGEDGARELITANGHVISFGASRQRVGARYERTNGAGGSFPPALPYTRKMLSEDETKELQARLKAELGRLVENGHSNLEFTMDRDRDRIGRDSMDESAEEELYSTQLRLADRENHLIGKIHDAFKRLETGDIDECQECSEPIGFKRLMARPMATMCFECKSAKEQVEADETQD